MAKTNVLQVKRGWGDKYNQFVLHNGVVKNGSIKFNIRRRHQTPALRFSTGDEIVLTYKGKCYYVTVENFAPRSTTGSVISAAGRISFYMHEGVARILYESPRVR
jgi:hypothetical protein